MKTTNLWFCLINYRPLCTSFGIRAIGNQNSSIGLRRPTRKKEPAEKRGSIVMDSGGRWWWFLPGEVRCESGLLLYCGRRFDSQGKKKTSIGHWRIRNNKIKNFKIYIYHKKSLLAVFERKYEHFRRENVKAILVFRGINKKMMARLTFQSWARDPVNPFMMWT